MKKFIGFFLLLLTRQGYAQSVLSDSTLDSATLEQCIEYAIAHQPVIEQAFIDERITNYQIRSRLAEWYPQIGTGFTYQHNFQRPVTVFNGTATPVGVGNTSTLQLYATQNIFNRDVLLANRTQNDVRLQSRQNTTARKIDITVNVSKAFYDILTTQQQIKVSDENIARLQRSISDAYYRYEAGVTDKTDYKRAQITLNNTVAGRKSYLVQLGAKREYLKSLMGYPVEAPINVVYDSLKLEREVSFDTLQQVELSRRIEYQQLLTQKRLQEANVVYQRNAYLPTLSANATYNANFLNNNIGKLYGNNFPSSFVGLTAGFPIFQGGKRRANIKTAELQASRVDLDIVNLRNTINSQYASALAGYKSSLANYNASKENVALAQEVYDVIQLQYRAGIKTYLEVITSETDLRTSQINYFNALYQVLVSKVDAQRALGLITY